MGTWGYEPCNSDSAHDLMDGVQKSGIAYAKKLFDKPPRGLMDTHARYARVGVVQMLSEKYEWAVPLKIARATLKDLKACLADALFMSDWRSPERAKQQITSMIAELELHIYSALARSRKAREKGWSRRRGGVLVYGPIFGGATKEGKKKERAEAVYRARRVARTERAIKPKNPIKRPEGDQSKGRYLGKRTRRKDASKTS